MWFDNASFLLFFVSLSTSQQAAASRLQYRNGTWPVPSLSQSALEQQFTRSHTSTHQTILPATTEKPVKVDAKGQSKTTSSDDPDAIIIFEESTTTKAATITGGVIGGDSTPVTETVEIAPSEIPAVISFLEGLEGTTVAASPTAEAPSPTSRTHKHKLTKTGTSTKTTHTKTTHNKTTHTKTTHTKTRTHTPTATSLSSSSIASSNSFFTSPSAVSSTLAIPTNELSSSFPFSSPFDSVSSTQPSSASSALSGVSSLPAASFSSQASLTASSSGQFTFGASILVIPSSTPVALSFSFTSFPSSPSTGFVVGPTTTTRKHHTTRTGGQPTHKGTLPTDSNSSPARSTDRHGNTSTKTTATTTSKPTETTRTPDHSKSPTVTSPTPSRSDQPTTTGDGTTTTGATTTGTPGSPATKASSSASSSATVDPAPPASDSSDSTLSTPAIAGIAASVGTSALVAAVALAYILRRRYVNRGSGASSPGVYPEEAYLYDPPMPPVVGGLHSPPPSRGHPGTPYSRPEAEEESLLSAVMSAGNAHTRATSFHPFYENLPERPPSALVAEESRGLMSSPRMQPATPAVPQDRGLWEEVDLHNNPTAAQHNEELGYYEVITADGQPVVPNGRPQSVRSHRSGDSSSIRSEIEWADPRLIGRNF